MFNVVISNFEFRIEDASLTSSSGIMSKIFHQSIRPINVNQVTKFRLPSFKGLGARGNRKENFVILLSILIAVLFRFVQRSYRFLFSWAYCGIFYAGRLLGKTIFVFRWVHPSLYEGVRPSAGPWYGFYSLETRFI